MKKLNLISCLMLASVILSCTKDFEETQENNSQETTKDVAQDTLAMHKEYQAFLTKNPNLFKDNPDNISPYLESSRVDVDPEIFNIIQNVGSFALGQNFTVAYNLFFRVKTPGNKVQDFNQQYNSLIQEIRDVPYRTVIENANSKIREAEASMIGGRYGEAKNSLQSALAAYRTPAGFGYSPSNILMALSMYDICCIKLGANSNSIASKQSLLSQAKDQYRLFFQTFRQNFGNSLEPGFDTYSYQRMQKSLRDTGIAQSYLENVLEYNSRIWTRNNTGAPRDIGSIGYRRVYGLHFSADGYLVALGHPAYQNGADNHMTIQGNGKYRSITVHQYTFRNRHLATHDVNWNNGVKTLFGIPFDRNPSTLKFPPNNNFSWTFCPVDNDAYYVTHISGISWNWGYNGIKLTSLTRLSKESVTPTAKIRFTDINRTRFY